MIPEMIMLPNEIVEKSSNLREDVELVNKFVNVDIAPTTSATSAVDSQSSPDQAPNDSTRTTTGSRHLFREKVFTQATSCNFCMKKV